MSFASALPRPLLLARRHEPELPPLLQLQPGQLWTCKGLAGVTITCRRGCAWLTHDRDRRDIVLDAGESHHVDTDRRLVIQAIKGVELGISR